MVVNKKKSKIQKFYVLQITFFLLKLVGILLISSLYDSTTSSQIIAESSIILEKYLPFSQLHVAGFQI